MAEVQLSPSSTMHGAALVSEHIFPLFLIVDVQQSNPFLSPQPSPPQYPQPTWGDTYPRQGRACVVWDVDASNRFDAGEARGT